MYGRAIDMKTCSKCKIEKELSAFGKHSTNKDGLQYQCKECRKETNAISFKKRYLENPEKFNSRARADYKRNHSKSLQRLEKYRASTKGKSARSAAQSKRKAAHLQRMPKWSEEDKIKAYYDVCAFFNEVNGYTKYHVDHIIPLQGKNVSGLHVQNNLQILPATENISKGNKYDA